MELPEEEADILELAMRLVEVMEQSPESFADAPVSAAELRAVIEEYRQAKATSDEANAAMRTTHAERTAILASLKNTLKQKLLYADVDVHGEMEKLSGVGWGGETASDRIPPGPVRDVSVGLQGDDWVLLQWRPPVEGGPAVSYRVERKKPGGPWELAADAPDNDCLLSALPSRIEIDLRVTAVNRSGTSPPSETITVVL